MTSIKATILIADKKENIDNFVAIFSCDRCKRDDTNKEENRNFFDHILDLMKRRKNHSQSVLFKSFVKLKNEGFYDLLQT